MKDIIIIGAGPAGLTAAIYALRAGKSVLLLEAKTYGGQIVNTPEIDNYPAMPLPYETYTAEGSLSPEGHPRPAEGYYKYMKEGLKK